MKNVVAGQVHAHINNFLKILNLVSAPHCPEMAMDKITNVTLKAANSELFTILTLLDLKVSFVCQYGAISVVSSRYRGKIEH